MPAQPLRSFRLVCKPEQVPLAEALLHAQGFVFEQDSFFAPARRLLHGPLPLGSSLAAHFGYLYIQDRSSMLPPLALAPGKGGAALDMCASPGSKTGLLAQLVGPSGFVLGNEPSKKRLGTLRRNLRQLNLLCCGTSSFWGEHSPLPAPGNDTPETGWEHILLDPPCSGWGTVEKNPQVLRLWRKEKLSPLLGLQRRLLAEAARLLRPGGRLVYSTCTTNVEENEDQLCYAREELGLMMQPLPEVAGFSLLTPARQECAGVWRVDTGPDGQGFFVALLQKPRKSGAQTALPYPAKTPLPEKDRPLLPRESLNAPGVDMNLLPQGDIAVFNGVAHFLPARSGSALPPGLAWKGFPLGRLDHHGKIKTDPRLRVLMPPVAAARQTGFPVLDLEDIAPLTALLSGQSLAVDAAGPEMGLYYKGLPLCRLVVKGRRALMPA